jgi:hypothetical protein
VGLVIVMVTVMVQVMVKVMIIIIDGQGDGATGRHVRVWRDKTMHCA